MADGLLVKFFIDSVHLTHESEKQGRPIFEDREFVEIIPVGDTKTVLVRESNEKDRQRFIQEYERYKRGEGEKHIGTPLAEWPAMRPSQIRQLNYLNIFTVEHLSQCDDNAMQSIGPGARELVKSAVAYIERAKDVSVTTKYAIENERLKDELERVKEQVDKLVHERPVPREDHYQDYRPEAPLKRRPGRPRKTEVEVNA
jgi:hypothetical protein